MTWRRQQQLLATAIAHHLETGRPVGSLSLSEIVEGRWSAATIRNELAALEAMGYLKRVHSSSGRVPTDQGFRFLVDRLLARDRPVTATAQGLEGNVLRQPMAQHAVRLAYLADQMAAHLALPVMIGWAGAGEWSFARGGVSRLLGITDFETLDVLRHIAQAIESESALEQVIQSLAQVKEPVVRIGSEIAVEALTPCSLVATGFPKAHQGAIAVIGPKRMPYLPVISGLMQWAAWIERHLDQDDNA